MLRLEIQIILFLIFSVSLVVLSLLASKFVGKRMAEKLDEDD